MVSASTITTGEHVVNVATIFTMMAFSACYVSFIVGNGGFLPYSLAIWELSMHSVLIFAQLVLVWLMSRTKADATLVNEKLSKKYGAIQYHFKVEYSERNEGKQCPDEEPLFRTNNLWVKILTHLLVFMVQQVSQQGWLRRYDDYVPNTLPGAGSQNAPNAGTPEFYPYMLTAGTFIFFGTLLVVTLVVDSALYRGEVHEQQEVYRSEIFKPKSPYAWCGYIHYVLVICASIMSFLSFQGVQQDINVTSIFTLNGVGFLFFFGQHWYYYMTMDANERKQAFRKSRYYALKQFVFFIFYYAIMGILASYTMNTKDDVYDNGHIPKFDATLPHQHSYFYVWNIFALIFGSSLIVLLGGFFVHVYSCATNNYHPIASKKENDNGGRYQIGLFYYDLTFDEYMFVLAQQAFALLMFGFGLHEIWQARFMAMHLKAFAISFTVIQGVFCLIFLRYIWLLVKKGESKGIFSHSFIVHMLGIVYVFSYSAMGMFSLWHTQRAYNNVIGTNAENVNLKDPTMQVSVFYPSTIVMFCFISVVWIASVIETLSGGNYFSALDIGLSNNGYTSVA